MIDSAEMQAVYKALDALIDELKLSIPILDVGKAKNRVRGIL